MFKCVRQECCAFPWQECNAQGLKQKVGRHVFELKTPGVHVTSGTTRSRHSSNIYSLISLLWTSFSGGLCQIVVCKVSKEKKADPDSLGSLTSTAVVFAGSEPFYSEQW